MDSFKIIEPKYSKKKRNWLELIDVVLTILLIAILLWMIPPIIYNITDNETVFIILILLIISILAVIMGIVGKKIINAYFVIGHLDFNHTELTINVIDSKVIDYKKIKIVYFSTGLVYGRGGIISSILQIWTTDNELFEVQVLYKSDVQRYKKFIFLIGFKNNIIDVLKQEKIKNKWISKLNTHNTYK